jgi:2-polyprenyl-3-methyl-5-hydroxy-6-metoxy-1,4-benzoquinol methylase
MFELAKKWNREYLQGKWDHLTSLSECGRNAIIGMYCNYFHRRTEILDVGCGIGNITKYIKFKNYLGIDISKVALKKAKSKKIKNCKFINVSAEEFFTKKKFDIIIFNEVLYYLDALAILNKFESFLKKDGFFVISMWENPKTLKLWKKIEKTYNCIDSTKVIHMKSGNKWNVGIFTIKKSKVEAQPYRGFWTFLYETSFGSLKKLFLILFGKLQPLLFLLLLF